MPNELPAEGGGALSDDASNGGLGIGVEAVDLDAELGEDVELDEEEEPVA